MSEASRPFAGSGLPSISLFSVRNLMIVGATASSDCVSSRPERLQIVFLREETRPGQEDLVLARLHAHDFRHDRPASSGLSRMNFSVSYHALIMPDEILAVGGERFLLRHQQIGDQPGMSLDVNSALPLPLVWIWFTQGFHTTAASTRAAQERGGGIARAQIHHFHIASATCRSWQAR
jgi:hypothetical protein